MKALPSNRTDYGDTLQVLSEPSMTEAVPIQSELAQLAEGIPLDNNGFVIGDDSQLLTFIDLFSGIGGFHLALSGFGMKCMFACDSDIFCRATYSLNFGILPATDIEKVSADIVPAHDVLCAGVPCTTFSRSGGQAGTNDPRGRLYLHVLRLIESRMPKVVLIENVGQFQSLDGGPAFNEIVESLRDWGYAVYHDVLNAGDYGVPQSRKRLFIVGIRKSLLAREFRFPEPLGLKVDVASILEPPSRAVQQIVEVGDWKHREDSEIPWNRIGSGTIRLGSIKKGSQGDRIYSIKGLAPTLTAGTGGAGGGTNLFEVDGIVRSLTPKEAARCMGVPDAYRFLGAQRKAASQAGNAVVVNVVSEIIKQVFVAIGEPSPHTTTTSDIDCKSAPESSE